MIYIERTGDDHCPLAAITAYIMVAKGNNAGPFFSMKDGSPLRKDHFINVIRTALASAGINTSSYAGHSFCIGATTTAAQCGIQDSMIQTLGRWSSDAFRVYFQTPKQYPATIAASLTKTAAQATNNAS